LDLSAAQIPRRQFSVYGSMNPFIQQIFSVPLLIAYYCIAVGSALITYAALRIGYSMIVPWIPHLECCNCCTGCVKCIKLTSQAFINAGAELAKPWIHIPLLIGLILTVVVALLLFAAIEEAHSQFNAPLAEADQAILGVINQINTFTLSIPASVKGFTDSWENNLEAVAYTTANNGVNSVKAFLASAFQAIQNAINSCLNSVDAGGLIQVVIPDAINEDILPLIQIPPHFLPRIPLLDVSALLLPSSIAGVQRSLGPWVDTTVGELYTAATVILIVAIILIILPMGAVCGAFIKPFIPRKVNEFFLKPDYETTEEEQNANSVDLEPLPPLTTTAVADYDEEANEPKKTKKPSSKRANSVQVPMNNFAVSEPKFVENPSY